MTRSARFIRIYFLPSRILALLIFKLLAQVLWQQAKERRMILSNANQIRLILGPFAQAPPWILPRPDFALNQIRQSGNRDPVAQNFPHLGSLNERLIPLVSRELDHKIATRPLCVH